MGKVVAVRLDIPDADALRWDDGGNFAADVITTLSDGREVRNKFTIHVHAFGLHATRRDKINHSKHSKRHGNTSTR